MNVALNTHKKYNEKTVKSLCLFEMRALKCVRLNGNFLNTEWLLLTVCRNTFGNKSHLHFKQAKVLDITNWKVSPIVQMSKQQSRQSIETLQKATSTHGSTNVNVVGLGGKPN